MLKSSSLPPLSLSILLASAVGTVFSQPMPSEPPDDVPEDRARTAAELERTKLEVLDLLEGVSDAELFRRPEPERWSLAEIVDHLAVSEAVVTHQIRQALEEPARIEWGGDGVPRIADEVVTLAITNRDRRFTAPPVVQPSGGFTTRADCERSFLEARSASLELLGTEEDLRLRFARHPVFGWLDGVQYLLFVAGHTDRHLEQMREILRETEKAPTTREGS